MEATNPPTALGICGQTIGGKDLSRSATARADSVPARRPGSRIETCLPRRKGGSQTSIGNGSLSPPPGSRTCAAGWSGGKSFLLRTASCCAGGISSGNSSLLKNDRECGKGSADGTSCRLTSRSVSGSDSEGRSCRIERPDGRAGKQRENRGSRHFASARHRESRGVSIWSIMFHP